MRSGSKSGTNVDKPGEEDNSSSRSLPREQGEKRLRSSLAFFSNFSQALSCACWPRPHGLKCDSKGQSPRSRLGGEWWHWWSRRRPSRPRAADPRDGCLAKPHFFCCAWVTRHGGFFE